MRGGKLKNIIETMNKTSMSTGQISNYYRTASQLADFFEDILEAQGLFRPDFLRGLKRAHRESEQGKTKKIDSLNELR